MPGKCLQKGGKGAEVDLCLEQGEEMIDPLLVCVLTYRDRLCDSQPAI
jgi:hypothetical protein